MDKKTKQAAEEEKKRLDFIKQDKRQEGYKNLVVDGFSRMTPEKRKEARRKGYLAQQKVLGEKKTAKECLERLLPMLANEEILQAADVDAELIKRLKATNKEVTLYELIQYVAIGRAIDGNIKAAEYVRDTFGDKPRDNIDITANSLTDSDRALLELVSDRLSDNIIDTTGKEAE